MFPEGSRSAVTLWRSAADFLSSAAQGLCGVVRRWAGRREPWLSPLVYHSADQNDRRVRATTPKARAGEPASTVGIMPMRGSSRPAATQSSRLPVPSFPQAHLSNGLVVALLSAVLVAIPSAAWSAGDGTLQLHFMDVGQGDGAILIAPDGETILFDDGVRGECDRPLSYLRQLGIDHIDYHIASHYHADHIGCATEVVQAFPLRHEAFDRGGNYSSKTFTEYVEAVGDHRQTATDHTEIVLDTASTTPVVVDIVALNGNGVPTTNENDLSLVALIHFNGFTAEMGGDLSGIRTDNYEDIETSVAPKVGPIDVYKVHHHGSRYSSNPTWLTVTHPQVAVLSMGDDNRYGHPTIECLARLHQVVRRVYWTEKGAGVPPDSAYDVVGGTIIVHVRPGTHKFTVTCSANAVEDTFTVGAGVEHVVLGGNETQERMPSTAIAIHHYYIESASQVIAEPRRDKRNRK